MPTLRLWSSHLRKLGTVLGAGLLPMIAAAAAIPADSFAWVLA